MLDQYQRGETITLSLVVTDSAGTQYDPDMSIQIAITDPDGTAVIDYTDMTKSAIGEYYYKLTTTSSYELGVYRYTFKTVHSSETTIEADYFSLEALGTPSMGWSVESMADQLRSETDVNPDAAGGQVPRRDKKRIRELGSWLWNHQDWSFRETTKTLTVGASASTGTMPTDYKEMLGRVMRATAGYSYRLLWTSDVRLWQKAKDVVGQSAGAGVPRFATLRWTGSVWVADVWPTADQEYSYPFWYLTRDPWRGSSPVSDTQVLSDGYWPEDYDEGWYRLCAYQFYRSYRADDAWKGLLREWTDWRDRHVEENDERMSDNTEPIQDAMMDFQSTALRMSDWMPPGGWPRWYGST